jgi:hypothetical protein
LVLCTLTSLVLIFLTIRIHLRNGLNPFISGLYGFDETI